MKPVQFHIDGTLDLHQFNPRDVPDLLDDYIEACREKGIFNIRIIHGKGSGALKARVRSLLSQNARVVSFKDAPVEAGGWGATLVTLHLL